MTSDRLRWWIVGIVLGAAAMVCASFAADVGAGADDPAATIASPHAITQPLSR